MIPRLSTIRATARRTSGSSSTTRHRVGEAPPSPAAPPALPRESLVTLSGHTASALEGRVAGLRAQLLAHPGLPISDLAFTLLARRGHHRFRRWWVAADRDGLLDQLGVAASGGPAVDGLPGSTAWLFPGQGTQRPGMGSELAAAFPPFREAWEDVVDRLDRWLERPLRGW